MRLTHRPLDVSFRDREQYTAERHKYRGERASLAKDRQLCFVALASKTKFCLKVEQFHFILPL
jgi:hypothetical protein